jgi:MSHA pilin protein MshA
MTAARQSGFTWIELVVVIVILGILASFAVPRFAALDKQAGIEARDALAGGVRSGAALAHAMWLAQNQPESVTMEGKVIAISNGYPDRASINLTLQGYTGFTYAAGTGVFARVAPATCTVTYTAPATPNLPPTIELSGAATC